MPIYRKWLELSRPTAEMWTAIRVGPLVRLARTGDGGAAVLVRHPDGEQLVEAVGLRTTHIEYTPHRELSIERDDERETGKFAVLSCDGDDDLVRHFLRLVATLTFDEGAPRSVAEFDRSVRQAFELFRGLQRAGTRTLQGIWAETLVAAYAREPAYLIQAWHSDPHALHDFVGDGSQMEVKSTSGLLREHELSLAQLTAAAHSTVLVSILVQSDGAGASILDLLDRVAARVRDTELARRAEVVVSEALGEQWREAQDARYRVEEALSSLRVYSADEVPRPPDPIPPTVRNVRFRVDLSGSEALFPLSTTAHQERMLAHPLLRALLPLDRHR